MKKLRINVTGRVQGVGFRYMTKIVADQMNVYGSVKNELDGSVTIEAIAEDDTMKKFLTAVKRSPSPSGHVDNMTVTEDSTIKDSTKFSVKH